MLSDILQMYFHCKENILFEMLIPQISALLFSPARCLVHIKYNCLS